MTSVLIPVKMQHLAKTRLSALLDLEDRKALNSAMLKDLLNVVCDHPEISSVFVVSNDMSVDDIARQFSVTRLNEPLSSELDLNRALESACDHIDELHGGDVVILHSDLPLLKSADIDRVLDLLKRADVDLVLGPDSNSTGTNLLAYSNSKRPRLCFGMSSFSAHNEASSDQGLSSVTIGTPGISWDVDTPADLEFVFEQLEDQTERTFTLDALIESQFEMKIATFHSPTVVGELQVLEAVHA